MLLDDIKMLLQISGNAQDGVLNLMISDAKAQIRDYCNRKDFPIACEYVVRELVTDAFRTQNNEDVSSIRIGDTQVSYTKSITKEAFTEKQKAYLNKFKMVKLW